jgi:hypothetical protein
MKLTAKELLPLLKEFAESTDEADLQFLMDMRMALRTDFSNIPANFLLLAQVFGPTETIGAAFATGAAFAAFAVEKLNEAEDIAELKKMLG